MKNKHLQNKAKKNTLFQKKKKSELLGLYHDMVTTGTECWQPLRALVLNLTPVLLSQLSADVAKAHGSLHPCARPGKKS